MGCSPVNLTRNPPWERISLPLQTNYCFPSPSSRSPWTTKFPGGSPSWSSAATSSCSSLQPSFSSSRVTCRSPLACSARPPPSSKLAWFFSPSWPPPIQTLASTCFSTTWLSPSPPSSPSPASTTVSSSPAASTLLPDHQRNEIKK